MGGRLGLPDGIDLCGMGVIAHGAGAGGISDYVPVWSEVLSEIGAEIAAIPPVTPSAVGLPSFDAGRVPFGAVSTGFLTQDSRLNFNATDLCFEVYTANASAAVFRFGFDVADMWEFGRDISTGAFYLHGNQSGSNAISLGGSGGERLGISAAGVVSLASLAAGGFVKATATTGALTVAGISTGDVSGLGTMATQNANAVAITGGTITGLGAPLISSDAATKGYVDGLASGFNLKASVVAASLTPLILATIAAGSSVGGVTLGLGDSFALLGQSSASENWVYVAGSSGPPVRRTDLDTGTEIVGSLFYATGGTNAGKGFLNTNTSITLGTTAITFIGVNSLTGALIASNNLSDVASAATSRTNLGLVAVASSGSASDLTAGTLAAARLPAFTGDATSTAGTAALTLAASGVTASTYGDASHSAHVTFDAKGRATSASSLAIAISAGQVSGLSGVATSGVSSGLTIAGTSVVGKHDVGSGAGEDIAATALGQYLGMGGGGLGWGFLTGDVVTSSGSLTNTIAPGVVTLAKMANLVSHKLIGNDAGSGAPVPIGVASGLSFSGSATITNDLITGKAGGQTIIGGIANGDPLSIESTSAGTLGPINMSASQFNITVGGNGHELTGVELLLDNHAVTGGLIIGTGGDGSFTADYTSGSMDRVRINSNVDLVEQMRGVNPQTFNVYNTFMSTTNYERLAIEWSANVAHIQTQHGSGGAARSLALGTNNTDWLSMDGVGNSHFTGAGVRIDNNLAMNTSPVTGEAISIQGTSAADRAHFFLGSGTIPNGFGVHSFVTWEAFPENVASGGTVTQLNFHRINPATYNGNSSSVLTDPIAATLYISGSPTFTGSWATSTITLNANAVGLRVDAAAKISGIVTLGSDLNVTGNTNVTGLLNVSNTGLSTIDGNLQIGGNLQIFTSGADEIIQMVTSGNLILKGQTGDAVILSVGSNEVLRAKSGSVLSLFGATGHGQYTFGAKTAGATYGANEQTMLQDLWDMVRGWGGNT